MAQVQVIYWRDMPAQIKAQDGNSRATRPLPLRFQVAIGEAAMRAGLTASDDYIAQWTKVRWPDRDGEPDGLIATLIGKIEQQYAPARLRSLIKQGGLQKQPQSQE